jgi:hypothetical protein
MDIGTSIAAGTTLVAAIDWPTVITALDEGGLPASGGERRVLHLAASLADGIPVDLPDTHSPDWTRPTSAEPSARCSTPRDADPEGTERPDTRGIRWPVCRGA